MNDLSSPYDVNPEETQDIPLRSGALEESFILQPIRSLMNPNVGHLSPDTLVLAAVDMMTEGKYGCVVVTEDDHPVGIFTERDLMNRVVAERVDMQNARLADFMTPNPECVGSDDEVAYALNVMVVGNFRHVPIVDDDYKLVGIFSIRDLQHAVVGHFEKEILTLPPRPMHRGPSRRYAG